MDPVDIRAMVERAKADASATGAIRKAPNEGLDSLLDDVGRVQAKESAESLAREIEEMVDRDAADEQLAKRAAEERGRLIKIAKLLAALDVIAEVRS